MVKSVTKVMDAMQLFLGTLKMTVPQNFIMTGASKRGWTGVHSPLFSFPFMS